MATKLAQHTLGDKLLVELDSSPVSSGFSAPIGSLAITNESGVGRLYVKKGSASTAWETANDEVHEYADLASFPATGVEENIYIEKTYNIAYRWDVATTSYIPISTIANKMITLVFNENAGTLTKGQVVYLSGIHGDRPNATLAQGNSEATSSKTFGLIFADIGHMLDGYVITEGRLEQLNTDITGWTEGDALWLSPTVAGGITNTKPSAPNHAVFIGILVRKHQTQGVIQVRIQNGYELQELHNVSITTPMADTHVLKYDTATSLWKNQTLGGADITQDSSYRFVTDIEKSKWNAQVPVSGVATGVTIDNTGTTLTLARPSGAFTSTNMTQLRVSILIKGTVDGSDGSALIIKDVHMYGGSTVLEQESMTSFDTNADVAQPSCTAIGFSGSNFTFALKSLVSGKQMTSVTIKISVREDTV